VIRRLRSTLVAIIAGSCLAALWLWLGVHLVGLRSLNLWSLLTLALILTAGAYADHKRNMMRASEPGYLLQGTNAIVVRALQPDGQVRVGSEVWSARSRGTTPVAVGTRVRVCGRDGLVLLVDVEGS